MGGLTQREPDDLERLAGEPARDGDVATGGSVLGPPSGDADDDAFDRVLPADVDDNEVPDTFGQRGDPR